MHPLQNVQLKSVAHMQFSTRTYIAFLATQFDLAGDRCDHIRGANVLHHGDWHSGHNGQGEEMSPPAGSCEMCAPIFPGRVSGWAYEQITAIVTGRLPTTFSQNANPRHEYHSGVPLRSNLCVCLTLVPEVVYHSGVFLRSDLCVCCSICGRGGVSQRSTSPL
jgi:hypothetical protein